MSEAVRQGFSDILLLVGYKAEAVRDYVEGVRARVPGQYAITLSVEPEPLGTGGALVHALPQLADRFLLLNGDTWFDFPWLDLFGVPAGGLGIAARRVALADRQETLEVGTGGQLLAIHPRRAENRNVLVNGGAYALTRDTLAGFEGRFSFEADVLPKLIAQGRLFAKEYDGFFLDIGIPQAFAEAQETVPAQRRRPALFLDRDGVLNHDDNYVGSKERLRWIDGAAEAIRLANVAGYYVFVVTNQAGVARGFYGEDDVRALHRFMSDHLRQERANIDDWRYCPHHPDGTVERYRMIHHWRKPGSGMIEDLIAHWPVDRSGSLLVGDKHSDLAAAEAAGLPGFLFKGGNLRDFLQPLLTSRGI
jgi:D-glycero-D-manno-heptose 1,7-bisphosphate phosphatase